MTTFENTTDHLAVAERIGTLLCRDAIWSGDRCNWLGWTMSVHDGAWAAAKQMQPSSLYDGTAGIALFLAELYRATGESLHLETALGALTQARSRADGLPDEVCGSLHNGPAGIAWVTVRLGEILGRCDLIDAGLDRMRATHPAEMDATRTDIDVVAGAGGLVPALIQVGTRHGAQDLVDRAVELSHGLVDLARPSGRGVSWSTGPEELRTSHLLGHAHGSSGIALALIEAWAVEQDNSLLATAVAAFDYERSHFDEQHRNWPDLREGISPGGFMAAWCHGAPGIGLSRLRYLEVIGHNTAIATDLDHALASTATSLSQLSNYSLCHGIGGNAELLLLAADSLGRPELASAAENASAAGTNHFHHGRQPWPCGVQGAGEAPNLMLGLAGIGHFYLRMHDRSTVESVLLLRGSVTPDQTAFAADATSMFA